MPLSTTKLSFVIEQRTLGTNTGKQLSLAAAHRCLITLALKNKHHLNAY